MNFIFYLYTEGSVVGKDNIQQLI